MTLLSKRYTRISPTRFTDLLIFKGLMLMLGQQCRQYLIVLEK